MIEEMMISGNPMVGNTCECVIDSPSGFGRRQMLPLKRTLCWFAAGLICQVALATGLFAQGGQTPVPQDTQCLQQNCPSDQWAPGNDSDATPGRTGEKTVAEPENELPTGVAQKRTMHYDENNNNDAEKEPSDPRKGTVESSRRFLKFRGNETPATPPTEFQEFVASSVGRKLPIYGSNLFDREATTFAPVDRIQVTDEYRIGPGDEIQIRAWGQIELNAKLLVDRGGAVFLPKIGSVFVAGLQYQQLPDYFRTALGRVFRNFDLTVSLGQLRSVEVFVVGQARHPGSYTVSALCTLVNALFASGGPTGTGSLRHIQLKRNNGVVTEFDLYDLLLKGDKAKDARLLSGDVIYIPPASASIALAGSVNMPAIYELREKTTLSEAIEMAGGLATTADGQKAVVERIENHSIRRVEEFALDNQGLERTLKDGDVVRILALSPRFENAVTLRGNVAHPGRVEWHSGMRLRDVIPNQEFLLTRDYWRAANSVANPVERVTRDRHIEKQAAPRKETAGATPAELRNQITREAPEINWDYAVIQRLNRQDLTTRLVPFNLGKLVLGRDEQNNLELEPGDVITIFSQSDLAVPLAKQSKFVRLEGEFRTSGVYQVAPGETIRQLVQRVGGLTSNAYLYGSEFTRESVRTDQQKGLDQMIEKLEGDITRNALAPSGISPEETADNRAKLEAQKQLVEKLREVRATGRVVLDLKPDSERVSDLPEIALEDGDRFVVPFRPSTVEMLGAVYSKSSFLYRREQRVDDYVKRAGGPTRDADTGHMFVIRADGSVLSKRSVKGLWNGGFASLRLMPGDAIVVPERLSHGSFIRGLRDWSQVFSQFALGAAAVRVIQ
jgi:protein involved in polysaccharide export with SLBB domain